MGYNGASKYVEEIDDYCSSNKCLFIVNKEEYLDDKKQTNKFLISYVIKNYIEVCSSNISSVYVN